MRFAKGLAARLFLTHLGLALLIIVAGGTYLTISLQRTYLHSLEASLQDHAHLLAEAVRPSLESGDYEHLRLTLDALNDRVEASAIVEDGQGVVVGSTNPELASLIGRPPRSRVFRPSSAWAIQRSGTKRLEAFPRPSHGSAFRLLIPIDPG